MGWASGSYLAEELWRDLKKFIAPANQKQAAKKIVAAFENHDADDWECEKGSLYRTAYPDCGDE